jgi:hypothetical protein
MYRSFFTVLFISILSIYSLLSTACVTSRKKETITQIITLEYQFNSGALSPEYFWQASVSINNERLFFKKSAHVASHQKQKSITLNKAELQTIIHFLNAIDHNQGSLVHEQAILGKPAEKLTINGNLEFHDDGQFYFTQEVRALANFIRTLIE